MEKQPQISIIVPVYNAKQTLERCIESIIGQSFPDFELLLVNDGSKDDSGEICDRYAGCDCRIKVFHQQNAGVSSARNKGLDNATGKYICFIDSDDWVERHYLSDFFSHEGVSQKTLIFQSMTEDSEKGSRQKGNFENQLYTKSNFSDLFTDLDILSYGYPFCKLYDAEIVTRNKIRFDRSLRFAEDLLFFLQYLKHVDEVQILPCAGYHYISIQNIGSLSNTHNSYESEIHGYYTIKKALGDIINIFGLNDKAIVYCRCSSGSMLDRSIRTIYRPRNRKSYKERMGILKELSTTENNTNLAEYRRRYNNEFLNRFANELYTKKMFRTYDAYMRFFIFVRYKWSFIWKFYRKLLSK